MQRHRLHGLHEHDYASASAGLTHGGSFGVVSGTTNIILDGTGTLTYTAGGDVRYGGTTGTVSGTTVINVNGTGTLDGPSTTTGRIDNPITINAPGGRLR